jgi:CoA:oxalate CoA-transferase
MSGLSHLTGSPDDPPLPVGIAIADVIASIHMAHGVTAALYARERTGEGARIETSLLESMLDLQLELLSAHLTDPSVVVRRGPRYAAHPFLQAPYGVYPTADGHLALAMGSVPRLGALIGLPELERYTDPDSWWSEQAAITDALARHLATGTTAHWLAVLDAADVWCAPVLDLPALVAEPGFAALDMTQQVRRTDAEGRDVSITTLRTPLRVNGRALHADRGAPHVGEHTDAIREEFGLRAGGHEGAESPG